MRCFIYRFFFRNASLRAILFQWQDCSYAILVPSNIPFAATEDVPMPITECRSCGSKDLHLILDLGETPIANALRKGSADEAPEERFPLAVVFCGACSLLQVTETIPPSVIFERAYPYYSSSSDALLLHAREAAHDLIARRGLDSNSLVVEIASNDGYLLRNFVAAGIPVVGIDPAGGPAAAAQAIGIPMIQDFFRRELALRLAEEHGRADVIIANNVLAHVPEINDFVAGIAIALKPGGVAVFEFPYAVNMIDACEFDTIYHEHVFYYSLTALEHLFRRHDLFLNDAIEIAIHGGSLRLFVSHDAGESPRLRQLLARELARGVGRRSYYDDFAARVEAVAKGLSGLLRELKAKGGRIAAYGAAAKGATLLNFIRPPAGVLDYVVDRNPHKQGKLLPGLGLPIRAPETLAAERPDFTLLLSWNFAEEILRQQDDYLAEGGRFIIPIPEPRIVGAPSQGRAEAR
jgi:SAM-dependent methyltransferase